ncbi:MAG: CPBP family intramembrane glutamic endopeptidase [Pseudomonadota bacterium]
MAAHSNAVSKADGPQSPLAFLVLTIFCAVPFWLLAELFDAEIMPGLPVSALMVFAPAGAAFALRLRESGLAGAGRLATRVFDAPRVTSWIWYLPALFLMPAVSIAAFVVSSLAGVDIPPPDLQPAKLAMLAAIFFVAAALEEIGWVGYALDPLQERVGEVRAALTIGVVWVVFHLAALIQVGRSAEWIFWWAVGTLAIRIFMTRLYNAAGASVFLVSLFHASQNVSWQAYPVRGSHYDPRLFGALFVLCALVAFAMRRPSNSRSA